METEQSTKAQNQGTLFLVAAGLFVLAAVFEFFARNAGLSALFVSVGGMWVAIAAKYRREGK
jgi:hypothetical protein